MLTQHIARMADNAPAVTYGGAATTLVVWGLHWSDIAAIGGLLIGFCGLMLQFYMVFRRVNAVEQQQVAQAITSAGHTNQIRDVATAMDAHNIECQDVKNRITAVEIKADGQKGLVKKEMLRQDAASAKVETRVTTGEADRAATHKVITTVADAQRVQADKSTANTARIDAIEKGLGD